MLLWCGLQLVWVGYLSFTLYTYLRVNIDVRSIFSTRALSAPRFAWTALLSPVLLLNGGFGGGVIGLWVLVWCWVLWLVLGCGVVASS